jgi:hypothetical protein
MAFSPTKEILDCGSNYLIHMGAMFELCIRPVNYLCAWWGGKFLCNARVILRPDHINQSDDLVGTL